MATVHVAKRRCTQSSRKKLLQATKEVCQKRLSELTDDELGGYLQTLGWPKTLAPAVEAYEAQGSFIIWLLNRMLTQLKKWMTLQASGKLGTGNNAEQSDGAYGDAGEGGSAKIGIPSIFRPMETKLVAYLVSHTSNINALYAHSHVLLKMAMFHNTWGQVPMDELALRDFENPYLKLIEAPNAEEALARYKEALEAVNDLLRATYYHIPPQDDVARTNNRIHMSSNLNDVADRILDDVNMFVRWNHAFQSFKPATANKKVVKLVAQITCALAEHLGILSEIMRELMEASSNAKHAYHCAAQTLMAHVLLVCAEMDDFKIQAKLLFRRTANAAKDSTGDKFDQRINTARRRLTRMLTFTLTSKFIPGLKEMLKSKEYEDLFDMEQLGNMDLEDSAVTYNRRFLLNIVSTIHRAEGQEEALQQARGLCIVLVELLSIAIEGISSQTPEAQDPTYYGVMMFAVILPLIMRLVEAVVGKVEKQPESYVPYAAVVDVARAFYEALNLANNKQILVYSGERAELVAKINSQATVFVLKTLESCYGSIENNRKRKALMDSVQSDENVMKLLIKKAHAEQHENANATAVAQIMPIMWDALLLLVSLSLEHADENIRQILKLLNQDYAFHNSSYEEHAFKILIKPQLSLSNVDSHRKSHVFAANLISMYSHANDMAALLDHMGEFVEQIEQPGAACPFMLHPPAMQAFNNSSKESSSLQIPIIIKQFAEWLKKDRVRHFMQYPLMAYLRGIELSATLVMRTADAFEELIRIAPVKHDPEGVLMAVQFIIIIRKIVSWSTMDDSTNRWDTYLNNIYVYVGQLAEAAGKNCSIAIWTAMFWFAYHFTLIIRDQPHVYGHMQHGINRVIRRLRKIARANSDDQSFVEDANALIVANANVFDNEDEYNALIKTVCNALMCFKKDARVLDNLKGTLDVLATGQKLINEIADINFLTNLVEILTGADSGVDLKIGAARMLMQVLQYSPPLFQHEAFEQLFYALPVAAQQAVVSAGVRQEDVMEFVKELLATVNFILRREEQLGGRRCSILTLSDYLSILDTSAGNSELTDCGVRHSKGVMHALCSVKQALNLNTSVQLRLSLAILQQIASVHTFIMAKIADEGFMDIVGLKTGGCDVQTLIERVLNVVVPAMMGASEKREPDAANDATTVSREDVRSDELVDSVLLAYINKTWRSEKGAIGNAKITRIQYHRQLSDILHDVGNALEADSSTNEVHILYLASVLYSVASSAQDNEHGAALEQVANIRNKAKSIHHIAPDVIEAMYEAVLEVLYRCVPTTTETQIHSHAVHALTLTAYMQHAICFKRQRALGFGGTQLEIYKALSGCQVDKVAEIVQAIHDHADPKQLWIAFTKQLERVTQEADEQPAPYDWRYRAAMLEVMVMFADKSHLKALYSLKGAGRKKILATCNVLLCLNAKQIENVDPMLAAQEDTETMHWVVLNYLLNTAVSIKLFVFTRFQVNKQMQETQATIAQHLLELARLGIDLLKKCKQHGLSRELFEQIATNVYLALYNCIRIAEGMSNAQIAKLVRPWVRRVHVVTYIITRFVELMETHDADMFAYVARWMSIISNEQLVDATKWYIPHMVTAIVKAWHRVSKDLSTNKTRREDVLRSNKILRSCIIETMGACDDNAVKTLFLLLSQDLRLFVKESTRIFNRN
ncbi:hypothetical protein, conserved [Babesia bigemina]|uniref:Uncharacterized protein n=1 Tax=Babesia bigemina TaxID=5866 RepID=A0A061DBV5_BABBI|nr:hypothetical protein, conserved [Babesia bigemina]CDR97457.1 hypothetical protein, conserved [Babesia bigemina]|eukprot:XP_012769643.1 hypothetical protein, conserved [Babesia bigemina]